MCSYIRSSFSPTPRSGFFSGISPSVQRPIAHDVARDVPAALRGHSQGLALRDLIEKGPTRQASSRPGRDQSVTLRLPDETKHARIVNVVVGPVGYLQLRHVPSDWVIVTVGHGPASAVRLR